MEDAEDAGVDLNLVMSAARMHRLRHNAGGPKVGFHRVYVTHWATGFIVSLHCFFKDQVTGLGCFEQYASDDPSGFVKPSAEAWYTFLDCLNSQ